MSLGVRERTGDMSSPWLKQRACPPEPRTKSQDNRRFGGLDNFG
ncbi:hypothetical protein [Arthrobacter methylotrophus]